MSPTPFKDIFFFTTMALIISCGKPNPFNQFDSLEVRDILENGIRQAGGLEMWNNSPSYQFKKRTILYHEDGSVSSKNTQIIQIKNQPELSGSIIWDNLSDSVSTTIEYKEGRAIKIIDALEQGPNDNEEARKTFLGAHIAMSLPFKLLDPGVKLTYGGIQEQFGKEVKVLIADYHKKNKNHTEAHRWWHYFDSMTYDYLGYKVYHPPTYALVENLQITSVNGITYPADRIIWRVDSLSNKQYIRGKFSCSDFEILAE